MGDVSAFLDDGIFAQLRADFLIDARERLDEMESAAGGGLDGGLDRGPDGGLDGGEDTRASNAGALLVIRREAHSLKGLASSLGFPSITLIAHRLEDFTAELTGLDGPYAGQVLAYIDCLRDIVDSGQDPGDEKASMLLRRLPAHTGAPSQSNDFEVNEASRVEVLLVAPGRAVRRMITGELRALGFRVSAASSPWQALEMAARTKPDLMITSAVMEELSGIDLARALRSMTATEKLPLALLTSLESDHPDMARLPGDVAIVYLKRTVTDELGDLITRFDLA